MSADRSMILAEIASLQMDIAERKSIGRDTGDLPQMLRDARAALTALDSATPLSRLRAWLDADSSDRAKPREIIAQTFVTTGQNANTELRRSDLVGLLDALTNLLTTARHFDPLGPLDHLSCTEAVVLADVVRACGDADLAERMIELHALGDDEPDDEHHEQYVANRRAMLHD